MKQLLILLALLCAGHAVKRDLSGKVFTIPAASPNAHVKLVPDGTGPLNALTMCMRFFSTHSGQSLFSLAVPSNPDAFFLYKPSSNLYRVFINGVPIEIHGLLDEVNEWNSICCTWSSNNGLTTLWVNGKRSARQVLGSNVSLIGSPSIILGQDQDGYNANFHQSRSFVGDITDVHMWNSVLPPCEIRSFMDGGVFTSGNILNWKNLQYTINGPVYEETSDFDKMC